MKLIPHFEAFMRDTVNIDRSRLDNLKGAVDAIYAALRADERLAPLVLGKSPQGSWRHRTIIKPVAGNEFDADVLLILAENPDWSAHPANYVDEVHAALSRNSTYRSMLKPPKCRCVRVVYARDFYVDVVPYLELDGGRKVIVNRDEDAWEDTDPHGFSAWMQAKDGTAEGHLREVIRLMKYLRDHGGNFRRTRSVILTAILGQTVEDWKKDGDAGYYEDLPTALLHVVQDLNAWLKVNPNKPSIPDPSGATDPAGIPINFDHRWNEADYQNLRSKIDELAAGIKAAYEESEPDRSLELWQKVFGPDFKALKERSAWLKGAGAAIAGPASVRSARAG